MREKHRNRDRTAGKPRKRVPCRSFFRLLNCVMGAPERGQRAYVPCSNGSGQGAPSARRWTNGISGNQSNESSAQPATSALARLAECCTGRLALRFTLGAEFRRGG